jgi:CheY-like chemotaxis protein
MPTLTDTQRDRIDQMSRLEMCRALRFGKAGDPLIAGIAGDYLLKRLQGLGGFPLNISRQIGWMWSDTGGLKMPDSSAISDLVHPIAVGLPGKELQDGAFGMAEAHEEPANEPDASLAQARILVVEDDDVQQCVLRSIFESGGFTVDTISNGRDAVAKIVGGEYDLVLLDYMLPVMDGMTIARLVREAMGEGTRPRLIALTALVEVVIGLELLSGKAFDGVLSKVVDVPELLTIVTRHLRTERRLSAKKANEAPPTRH